MSDNNNFLGEVKESKLLLKFAIPCVLSLLITALYNIVDQIFIGNSELGYLGNAATGVVFPIFIICQAFSWWLGDGCAAHLAICQGKKDTGAVHRTIGVSVLFIFVVSILLLVLALTLREPVLRLIGATDQSIDMASDYLTIVACFFPLFMFSNVISPIIRADGSPVFAMLCLAVGAVANIILDPIFIYVLKWGIAGAAWATGIGQTLSFILSLVYLFRAKTFRLSIKSFIPDVRVFKIPAILGISSFITQISIVIISVVCNTVLVKYGKLSVYGADIPISVISIETKIFTLLINIVVGIALGGQPIISYNVGANKFERIKKTYKLIVYAEIIIISVFTVCNEAYPDMFIAIFGSTSEVLYMEYARYVFRIFLSLVTLTCFIKVTSVFFQAAGKPVQATICSIARDIVVFVPSVVLIPLIYESNHRGEGILSLLFAAPFADLVCGIVTVVMVVRYFKSKKKPKVEDQDYRSEDVVATTQDSMPGVIVTISREHGTMGKRIGELLARKMGVPFYSKEIIALTAKNSGLLQENLASSDLYLSKEIFAESYATQKAVVDQIVEKGSCVIVGRAASHFIDDKSKIINVFIYADTETKIKNVMEMYGDDKETAIKNIKRSDASRAKYYNTITSKRWDDIKNYDVCINSSCGVEKSVEALYGFVSAR